MSEEREFLRERVREAETRLLDLRLNFERAMQDLQSRYQHDQNKLADDLQVWKRALVLESERTGSAPPDVSESLPLAEFFMAVLRTDGACHKDELRDRAMAAGYVQNGGGAAGRIVHMTLRNLVMHGKLNKTEGDVYSITAPSPELFHDLETMLN